MTRSAINMVLTALVGWLYWQFVCRTTGVEEPWDADTYWRVWYPLSFALSAMAGFVSRRQGWLAGAIVTFAQIPVMWFNTGTGSLWLAGVVMVSVLAVPVIAVAALAGRLAVRIRPD